jgi:hypothetical protein
VIHTLEEQALGRISRHDNRSVSRLGERAILCVEPKTGHTVLLIGTVTLEAVVRQNRTYIAAEVNGSGGGEAREGTEQKANYEARKLLH